MTPIHQVVKPELASILGQLRQQLLQLYGSRLVKVMLYGSQARGDALPDSDVDVLVVLKGEVNPFAEIDKAGDIAAAISLKHNIVISCLYISENKYTQAQNSLLYNVHREGVVV
jgi:predicted nucleotidyltransferase